MLQAGRACLQGAPAAMRVSSETRCVLARYGPATLVATLMLGSFALGWHQHLTLENIVAARDRFHGVLTEHRVLSLLAYAGVYMIMTVLSVPGGLVLTAAGGLLFGWLLGGIAAMAGATIGATLVFLVARTAIGDGFAARTAPWLDKLRVGFKDEALSYLLFLRLVPAFPFWFVNIAPAILGVPLKTYVIATFFGIIPGTFAFSSAGASLDSIIVAAKREYLACVAAHGDQACKLTIHASSLVTRETVLACVLLGCLALVPAAFRKWRTRHAAAK